ncbi:LIM homeobox transcription factor 1-alpha-like isoform X2 [Pseudophryne corroboree]|uniref:LIM homeobox transcription factor 1-alpha-like isoform X2 n=1 Tax=Pseudophryne corroboree TaxID=495146 RepID=UPI00308184C5
MLSPHEYFIMKTENTPSSCQGHSPYLGLDPKMNEMCAGCSNAISDRFLLRVNESSWHECCVKCTVCLQILSGTCYYRNRQLYCKEDYEKLFATKCNSCLKTVMPSELIMRVLNNVYHVACFFCCECERRLERGDEFVLKEGQLLCRSDYEREREMLSTFSLTPAGSVKSEDEDGSNLNGKGSDEAKELKRSKRPRTILTTQQRRAFKASFEVSSKPCRKMKKIARRQQQQDHEQLGAQRLGSACGNRGNSRQSNDDSEDGGSGIEGVMVPYSRMPQQTLLPLDQAVYSTDLYRQGLTPPQMPGDHLHPYDADVFHDMDNDGLNYLGGSLLTSSNSNNLQACAGPIDRLYSMQNSYFAS